MISFQNFHLASTIENSILHIEKQNKQINKQICKFLVIFHGMQYILFNNYKRSKIINDNSLFRCKITLIN